ncbi:MAG: NAD-dependent deacylase [Candidatus Azobacteroides sp.]|nr:NAD-dependent deacylase [Candidatus Azobacteroides sp.]
MKNLVVLTGAGMSAESGISTFRDSGGLWEQYRIEDVATPEAWRKNPELVLDFYNQRRRQLFEVVPNRGHEILHELEAFMTVKIITQNIDNLHEVAGSSSVLHLHGELLKVRSTGDDRLIYELSAEKPDIHLGDLCEKGFQLRPHIVWFGEAVPMISEAVDIVRTADVFLIIGTSLNVYPAAGLVEYVNSGVPIYLIDPKDVSYPGYRNIHPIKKGASEGMEEFKRIILNG